MKYDCPFKEMPGEPFVVSLFVPPVTPVSVTTSPSASVDVSDTVTKPVLSIEVAAIEVAGLPNPTLYTPDAAAIVGRRPANDAVKVASLVAPLPSQYRRSLAICILVR